MSISSKTLYTKGKGKSRIFGFVLDSKLLEIDIYSTIRIVQKSSERFSYVR